MTSPHLCFQGVLFFFPSSWRGIHLGTEGCNSFLQIWVTSCSICKQGARVARRLGFNYWHHSFGNVAAVRGMFFGMWGRSGGLSLMAVNYWIDESLWGRNMWTVGQKFGNSWKARSYQPGCRLKKMCNLARRPWKVEMIAKDRDGYYEYVTLSNKTSLKGQLFKIIWKLNKSSFYCYMFC